MQVKTHKTVELHNCTKGHMLELCLNFSTRNCNILNKYQANQVFSCFYCIRFQQCCAIIPEASSQYYRLVLRTPGITDKNGDENSKQFTTTIW